MTKKLFAAALFCAFIFTLQTSAKASYPPAQNERFVIRALRQIYGAQYTYYSTAGNGSFGSFSHLRTLNLIDAALASGSKYGYTFSMETINASSPTNRAAFRVTATPRLYRKTGRRSFYLDDFRGLHSADKNGAPANADDPLIEDNCLTNEDCTISNLLTLHSAEFTYFRVPVEMSYNFGTLAQLRAANLISELLAQGSANGYNFTVTPIARTSNSLPSFSISAVPITYGTTSVRSFYIDVKGVIHAADHHGEPATADDPVIE